MKRLAVFDLDGTLLNTIDDLAASTNYALGQCGFPLHEVEEYYRFVGNGITSLFRRALPAEACNDDNVARVRVGFLKHYSCHNTDFTRPYDGIPDLLRVLDSAGVLLAVASNKYQSGTEKLIGHFFPDIPFAAILGQREGIPVKPDPAVLYEILAATGVSPEETLYIGDSDVDMLTARSAGIESVGVTWGFRTREELRQSGACHLADTAAEIIGLCGIGR